MALHIYNSLTRQRERFEPADPKVVRIYTCGLTVYSYMHIGHARTYCFWDFFRRYLEYLGYHVISVINYTDIDDRIMKRSDATRGCIDVAEEFVAQFRLDSRRLHLKDYAAYTRATDFIDEQATAVRALIDKGHAYVTNGEVFYSVESFSDYGQLSGKKVDDLQTGASGRLTEDAQRKRHPADFTLWKPSDDGQPSWPTGQDGWPDGRPGWHIECSAMSSSTLGSHFDIHGGAVDNLFPHHENEIAQSEPLCGKPWVRYWMHPEHLDLHGDKMSKSIGNVIGVPKLLESHTYDEVRFFLAMTHYRTRLPFSDDLVDSAAEAYGKVMKLVRVLEKRLGALPDEQLRVPVAGDYASLRPAEERAPRMRHIYTHGAFGAITTRFMSTFRGALDDDLNGPQATAALFAYVNELYAAGIEQSDDAPSLLAAYRALTRHLFVLGCEHPNERLYPELAAECQPAASDGGSATHAAVIDKLVAMRQDARANKEFAKSDLLRDVLKAAGVTIEDTPRGPRWEID